MNHEQAERLLSARIDGERLSTRASASLEQHLETCAECRAERSAYRLREAARFQVAPAVPDLVDQVMTAVGAEAERPRSRGCGVRPAGSSRRSILPRLAPVAAALIVGALIGNLVVGGPCGPRPGGARRHRGRRGHLAPRRGSTYQATFVIDERHCPPRCRAPPDDARVVRGARTLPPGRRRPHGLPTPATPTNLKLVVDGSTWYAAGPAPCPTATCPQRESVVRNRLPFRPPHRPHGPGAPISTLADADRLTVLGRGTVLGRPAVRVEVPFERAEPLSRSCRSAATGGRSSRTSRPDLARRTQLVPVALGCLPATGAERDAWAPGSASPASPRCARSSRCGRSR